MPSAASSKKNGIVSRKRVDADPGAMKRGSGGSAFSRCNKCNKDIPAATADMHDCQGEATIKASLGKPEKDVTVKGKATDKTNADGDNGGKKRKASTKVVEKRGKKSKPAKDPNMPKRPTTAYFLFMSDFRTTWKAEHENEKMSVGDVAKQAGQKWKAMSDEEKAPYLAAAAEKKVEYDAAMKSYKSGGKSEEEAAESEGNEEEVEEGAAEEGADESLVDD